MARSERARCNLHTVTKDPPAGRRHRGSTLKISGKVRHLLHPSSVRPDPCPCRPAGRTLRCSNRTEFLSRMRPLRSCESGSRGDALCGVRSAGLDHVPIPSQGSATVRRTLYRSGRIEVIRGVSSTDIFGPGCLQGHGWRWRRVRRTLCTLKAVLRRYVENFTAHACEGGVTQNNGGDLPLRNSMVMEIRVTLLIPQHISASNTGLILYLPFRQSCIRIMPGCDAVHPHPFALCHVHIIGISSCTICCLCRSFILSVMHCSA